MGKCTNFKKIGDPCFHRNECGRSAACFYKNGASITGICTQYMLFENNAVQDVSMKVDNYAGKQLSPN